MGACFPTPTENYSLWRPGGAQTGGWWKFLQHCHHKAARAHGKWDVFGPQGWWWWNKNSSFLYAGWTKIDNMVPQYYSITFLSILELVTCPNLIISPISGYQLIFQSLLFRRVPGVPNLSVVARRWCSGRDTQRWEMFQECLMTISSLKDNFR